MNLFEQLTPAAKHRLKAAAENYSALIETIENDLKNNEIFYLLKYNTIFNLNATGVINGFRPSDIQQLFND